MPQRIYNLLLMPTLARERLQLRLVRDTPVPQSVAQPMTPVLFFLFVSNIRATLIDIMANPAAREPSDSVLHWGEQCQSDTFATDKSLSAALGGSQVSMGPPTCIFWCAVALGALVKGSPFESVRSRTSVACTARKRRSLNPVCSSTDSLSCMVRHKFEPPTTNTCPSYCTAESVPDSIG